MTNRRVGISTIMLAVVFAAPSFAHHSIAGTYDTSKGVTIKGMITNLEWRNPHSFVSLSAKDDNGRVTNWSVQLAAAATLTTAGLTKELFDLTRTYSMDVFPAKDGSTSAVGNTLTFADGKTFEVIDKLFNPPAK